MTASSYMFVCHKCGAQGRARDFDHGQCCGKEVCRLEHLPAELHRKNGKDHAIEIMSAAIQQRK